MLVTPWPRVMTSSALFQNIFILRRPRVPNFADIIKIKTFKDLKEVGRTRNYVLKCNIYPYFLIQQKLLIFGEKMLMLAEIKGCVTWFMCFLYLLYVRYNCTKFHHCRVSVTDCREGVCIPLCRNFPLDGISVCILFISP